MTANTLCPDCNVPLRPSIGGSDCPKCGRFRPYNPNAVALGKLGGLAGKGKSTKRQRIASQQNVAKARAVMAAKRAAQKEETK